MNDTGSDILTLFTTDLLALGNTQGYQGWHGVTGVMHATGTITIFPRILVQVQLVRDDNIPWSDRINEYAIVKEPAINVVRLLGVRIRHTLDIGTAPGNDILAISASKGGLTSLL